MEPGATFSLGDHVESTTLDLVGTALINSSDVKSSEQPKFVKANSFILSFCLLCFILCCIGGIFLQVIKQLGIYLEVRDEPEQDLKELIRVKAQLDDSSVEDRGQTLLHVALREGRPDSARKLVERGVPLNCATVKLKNTPLHFAANGGNPYLIGYLTRGFAPWRDHRSVDFVPIAELLLDKGADPNLENSEGNGPLHVAAATPNGAAMSRLLAERGAHVDLRNMWAETPLTVAVRRQHDPCIRELLIRGANVHDEAVAREITPLYVAVYRKLEPWMLFGAILHDKVLARELRDFEDMPEELWEHWIKLYAAKMRVFGEWHAKEVAASCESFRQDCLKEVETLKSTRVKGNLSLYEWLHLRPTVRCSYIDDKQLKILVESPELEERFPNYYVVILGCYRESIERQSLLKLLGETWYAVTKSHLPDACIERSFGHLTNADMLDLIKYFECSTWKIFGNSVISLEAQLSFFMRWFWGIKMTVMHDYANKEFP